MKVWHSRLGYLESEKEIKSLIDTGVLNVVKSGKSNCNQCSQGIFRYFRGSLTKANVPGYIHADVVGRINPMSHEYHKYVLVIIDEHSRYIDVRFLKRKSEASQQLINFMKWFESLTRHLIKALHADRGSECAKGKEVFE